MQNKKIEKANLIKEALHYNGATGIQFCGINAQDFISGIAPSFEKRQERARLKGLLLGVDQEIDLADVNTGDLVRRIMDGIRCHPDYGHESALYIQCGYVPPNQRRSGLTRPGNIEPELPASGQIPSGQAP